MMDIEGHLHTQNIVLYVLEPVDIPDEHRNRLPSLMGRDVLNQFVAVLDPPKETLHLNW